MKLSIVLHTWIANKKACDPIFETIYGELEEARLVAQQLWQAYYPGAAKQIFIYTYGGTWLNRKDVLLQANNFDKFESAHIEVRKGMKAHARMWSNNL